MKIGLISDTHSHIDDTILEYLKGCDEIWHAGDIGTREVITALETIAPTRAVFGNIDDKSLQIEFPENAIFEIESKKVWITHIGGYPPRYTTKLKKALAEIQPDIFICGHSHILKVIPDKERGLLHINPGAAGQHGFHQMRTLITFHIHAGKIFDMNVVELGKRGRIS